MQESVAAPDYIVQEDDICTVFSKDAKLRLQFHTLGYSKTFSRSDPAGEEFERLIGRFRVLQFHLSVEGRSARIEIRGDNKGAMGPFFQCFSGPAGSRHRMENGSWLDIILFDGTGIDMQFSSSG